MMWITDDLCIDLEQILSNIDHYAPALIETTWSENFWDGVIRMQHHNISYDVLDDVEGAVMDICFAVPRNVAQGLTYTSHYFSSGYTLAFTPSAHGNVHITPKSEPDFFLPVQEILPALLEAGVQFISLLRELDMRDPELKLIRRVTDLQTLADEARAALVANGYLDE